MKAALDDLIDACRQDPALFAIYEEASVVIHRATLEPVLADAEEAFSNLCKELLRRGVGEATILRRRLAESLESARLLDATLDSVDV
jgi:hypothetical protein